MFIVLATMAISHAAWGANVVYTTTGVFTGPGAVASTVTHADSILTYTGTTQSRLNIPNGQDTGAFFGTLHLVSPNGVLDSFAGNSFKLTVTQSVPTPNDGPKTLSGTLSGSISFSGGQLKLAFTSDSLTFVGPTVSENVVYSLQGKNWFISPPSPNGFTDVTLQGTLTPNLAAVPTPASVWGGMGLLGLVGFVKLSRKQLAV